MNVDNLDTKDICIPSNRILHKQLTKKPQIIYLSSIFNTIHPDIIWFWRFLVLFCVSAGSALWSTQELVLVSRVERWWDFSAVKCSTSKLLVSPHSNEHALIGSCISSLHLLACKHQNNLVKYHKLLYIYYILLLEVSVIAFLNTHFPWTTTRFVCDNSDILSTYSMQVIGDVVNESELQCSSWLFCSVKVESTEHICIKHSLLQKKKWALGIWKLSKKCFVEREAFWFWHVSLMLFTDKISFWASTFYFWISCHLVFKPCILSFSLKSKISATISFAVKF